MWLTSIDHRSTVYNDAEMEHTPYSDCSTCKAFDTPEPKLMHPTDKKFTINTLAIIGIQSCKTTIELGSLVMERGDRGSGWKNT